MADGFENLNGFLKKMGVKGIRNNWKKRFFVQRDTFPNRLYYYTTEQYKKATPCGFINLEEAISVLRTTDNAKKNCLFQINTPKRIYHLRANDEESMSYWIDGISAIIRRLNDSQSESDSLLLLQVEQGENRIRDLEQENAKLRRAIQILAPTRSIDEIIDGIEIASERFNEDSSANSSPQVKETTIAVKDIPETVVIENLDDDTLNESKSEKEEANNDNDEKKNEKEEKEENKLNEPEEEKKEENQEGKGDKEDKEDEKVEEKKEEIENEDNNKEEGESNDKTIEKEESSSKEDNKSEIQEKETDSIKENEIEKEEINEEEGEDEESDSVSEVDTSGHFGAKVKFDFQARKNYELSFKVGDIVTVLSQHDNGWWLGCDSDGKQGYFPGSYVTPLEDPK